MCLTNKRKEENQTEMKAVYEELEKYVIKIMRESDNANPQEIATLPELIKILEKHYTES